MAEDIPPAVRRICYERDSYACRWCGRHNVALHLHHVEYRSEGGGHVPENLITLCYEHHAEAHSDKNTYQQMLKELLLQEPNVTALQWMRWKHADARKPETRSTGPVGRFFSID